MAQPHTATEQWQSFEIRMRRRRVERCVLRAAVALEAGALADARDAIEEAQRLHPQDPEVQELAARIAAARPGNGRAPRGSARKWVLAAAVVAICGGAVVTWPLVRSLPPAPQAAVTPRAAEPAAAAPMHPAPPSVRIAESSVVVPDAYVVRSTAEDTGRPAETEPARRAIDTPAADRPAVGSPALPVRTTAPESHAGATTEESRLASVSDIGDDTIRALDGRVRSPQQEVPPVPPLSHPAPAAVASMGTMGAANPAARLTAAPEPPVPAVAAPAPDERSVRAVLSRYEAAYSALDVSAAGAVYPAVDRRALGRAFEGLAAQSVSLGRCDVRVEGTSARAECAGTASWTPKVGGGTRTEPRRWQFELKTAGTDWTITQATVR